MSKQVHGNQKHMNQDNRVYIEKGLDVGTSLRQIAISIDKYPSTISKEIKKHRTCKRLCAACARCNNRCIDFAPINYHCSLLHCAPYVCNGCKWKTGCMLDKYYYRSTTAQRIYRTLLVAARTGINISQTDLTILDELISPLISKRHSHYMILQNHPEITLSEKTIYNYIEAGALTVKNIDLYKKVKYKIRKVHKSNIKNTQIFLLRTYKDCCDFLREYPDTNVVEMDTVV